MPLAADEIVRDRISTTIIAAKPIGCRQVTTIGSLHDHASCRDLLWPFDFASGINMMQTVTFVDHLLKGRYHDRTGEPTQTNLDYDYPAEESS